MERNQSIDLIKVVAMLMVLLLHTGVARHYSILAYKSVPEIYMIAGIAIPLFFMVSGYLLSARQPDFQYATKKCFYILRFGFLVCVPFDLLTYIITGGGKIVVPYLLHTAWTVFCILVFGIYDAYLFVASNNS